MGWLYFIILIFSALTMGFTYAEYRNERFSRKAFILIEVIEVVVLIATTVLTLIALKD